MNDVPGDTLVSAATARPRAGSEPPWPLPPLYLPAKLERFELLSRYVAAVVDRAGVGRSAGYRLRLAVEELAANAVTHGYAGRSGSLCAVGGADGCGGAWIRLEDRAPAFDPTTARRAPVRGLPASRMPIGGLGIHLALSAADEYVYAYLDGVNRSTVTVRRRAGEAA
jgi:serine/threonine-protein kinase RsbW